MFWLIFCFLTNFACQKSKKTENGILYKKMALTLKNWNSSDSEQKSFYMMPLRLQEPMPAGIYQKLLAHFETERQKQKTTL